jgi:hypothetical protein
VLVSAVGSSQAAGAAGSATPPGGGVISGGGGRPRYLVVADLALDHGDAAYTQRMAQAVEYVLRAHNFSAGRYTLGLQICDNSGTNGCTANAKAYAATPAVIGVIGPNRSICAGPEIPVLSRAGLAMVAPTPNAPYLTGATPGFTLYPTGTRNFVRLSFSATTRRESPPLTWQADSDCIACTSIWTTPKGVPGPTWPRPSPAPHGDLAST